MSKVQDLIEINGVYYPALREATPEELDAQQDTPELSAAELRERAYNTDPCIQWDGSMLTVTEAAQRWAYYAAEGNTAKTDALTVLIAEAKASIRAQWPEKEE